ncbi:membrane lipoprotein lipid attachment site-containing protein [Halobacillus salinus]|uniref:DUF4362 domain-containing protein n=1 Tax=Halobacillus salinus TaxID=192814 RepID=A0A4Z0GV94_9BACI|nr:membrane lipoprotein lipid attachment site-containing protein [Halobacillus salinus]TGB01128.1 hypothetical protein E4663_18425 [Halobacillus salinus]
MKKIVYFLIVILAVLSACSEADSENTYTVEDAEENGDVIVKHQSEDFEQIRQGALEVENIEKMNTLLEKVDNAEDYSVDVSIFNPNNTHYKNTFTADGQNITFENNYEGYRQSPAGTYTCRFIQKRGHIIYLSKCESEEGEEYSTMVAFIGTEEAFREAE